MKLTTSATAAIEAIEAVLAQEPPTLKPFVIWSRPSQGSDLLLFVNGEREVECAGCLLVAEGKGSYVSEKVGEVTGHIGRHRKAGHNVLEGLEHNVRYGWPAALNTK